MFKNAGLIAPADETFLFLSGLWLFSQPGPVDHDDPDIYKKKGRDEKEPERDLLYPHVFDVEGILFLFGRHRVRRQRLTARILRYPDPGIIEIVHESFVHVETRYEGQSN